MTNIILTVVGWLLAGWLMAVLHRSYYPAGGWIHTLIWTLLWPVVLALEVCLEIYNRIDLGITDRLALQIKIHRKAGKPECPSSNSSSK